MSTYPKHLITNGSLNPSLTLVEILTHFTREDWVYAARAIAMDVAKLHGLTPDSDTIVSDPENILTDLWRSRDELAMVEKGRQEARQVAEGKALYTHLQQLSFPGSPSLHLYPFQAIGYLERCDGVNNFVPKIMQEVIKQIERLNLRSDFGINNVNSQQPITSWQLCKFNTWALRFDISGTNTLPRIIERDDAIRSILSKATPDTIDIEHDRRSFSFNYSMWWD